MNTEILSHLFSFVGGLGMFLYGMNVMSDGLQKKAGDKLRNIMGFLTNNKFLGIMVGALITAIIQSSSATTVMVVGFVNSSIMTLEQAVGVIMGANIGTTVTAWIVSLNEWGSFFKPEVIAPVILGIGAFFFVFSKKAKRKDIGEILIGFSLLFIGLGFMSSSMSPLAQSKFFIDVFKFFAEFPILALLAGVLVTAIIQSSSASVGILQTLTSTGIVSAGVAYYITLGQNIGTCVTALISSAGANRTAKRAAVIHLLFNILGAIIFGVIIFILSQIYPVFFKSKIDTVGISIFHTVFNVLNTIILFPFSKLFVKLSDKFIMKAEVEEEIDIDNVKICASHLDKRFLNSPLYSISIVHDEIKHLANVVNKNLNRAIKIISESDEKIANKIIDKEKQINQMTVIITEYLVEISKLSLTEKQRLHIDNLLYLVNDIERIGDHCENIAESIKEKIKYNSDFSEEAQQEINNVAHYSNLAFTNSIQGYITRDRSLCLDAIKSEQTIDILELDYRQNHIQRMSQGACDAKTGVFFLDIISNLERISDHCANICELLDKDKNKFDLLTNNEK